jgi:hypothetical protein
MLLPCQILCHRLKADLYTTIFPFYAFFKEFQAWHLSGLTLENGKMAGKGGFC